MSAKPALTEREKARVRKLYAEGVTLTVLARMYGVALSTIHKTVREAQEAQ
jgi:transposase